MGQFADLASGVVYGDPVDAAKKPSKSLFVAMMQALDDALAADPTIAGLTVSGLGADLLSSVQGSEIEQLLWNGPGRVLYNSAGPHVLDADNFAPYISNFALYSGTVNIDVASLHSSRTYEVTAGEDTVVVLDAGNEVYFQGGVHLEGSTSKHSLTIPSNTTCRFRKESGGVIFAWIPDGNWFNVATGFDVRKMADGTYEVRYTRTTALSATTASTISGPGTFTFSSAKVMASTLQPLSGGGANLASPIQVTKLGTTHSLSANEFAIYNPNASATSGDIIIIFSNVTGP